MLKLRWPETSVSHTKTSVLAGPYPSSTSVNTWSLEFSFPMLKWYNYNEVRGKEGKRLALLRSRFEEERQTILSSSREGNWTGAVPPCEMLLDLTVQTAHQKEQLLKEPSQKQEHYISCFHLQNESCGPLMGTHVQSDSHIMNSSQTLTNAYNGQGIQQQYDKRAGSLGQGSFGTYSGCSENDPWKQERKHPLENTLWRWKVCAVKV